MLSSVTGVALMPERLIKLAGLAPAKFVFVAVTESGEKNVIVAALTGFGAATTAIASNIQARIFPGTSPCCCV